MFPTYPLYWLLVVILLAVVLTDSGSISVYTCPISFNYKDIFVIFVS